MPRWKIRLEGPSQHPSHSSSEKCAKPSPMRQREMFYLTTHSTHFIYGYMASDIWLRTILIVRKETRCRHIGYCYRLTARVLLYAPSHRQDNTYHGLCYTSRGALAGTRKSSMGPPIIDEYTDDGGDLPPPLLMDGVSLLTRSMNSGRMGPCTTTINDSTPLLCTLNFIKCFKRFWILFKIWNELICDTFVYCTALYTVFLILLIF